MGENGRKMTKMKKWQRTLVVTILSLLLIWIDEICKQYPESYYCHAIGFYLRDPEPISTSRTSNNNFSFSHPYGVQNSGATTTTVSSGTISDSTTTTT